MPELAARFEGDDVIFAIELYYEPGGDDPGRVFRGMASLIEAFADLDTDLARAVSVQIRPVQLLQDIEAGSLIAWLRTVVRQIDDEALKKLDWKPLIGQYLVRAKHRLLAWLDGKERVNSLQEIETLEAELQELAEETDVLSLPVYARVPRRALLSDLSELSAAFGVLRDGDRVVYRSPLAEGEVNIGFGITPQQVEDLLTAETRQGEYTMVLLVKKPDYLGTSMWQFRLQGHTVDGPILDEEWLTRFQAGAVVLRPGDAIEGKVHVEMKRAADGSLVAARYRVLDVHRVIRMEDAIPTDLFEAAPELLPPSERGRLPPPGEDNTDDEGE